MVVLANLHFVAVYAPSLSRLPVGFCRQVYQSTSIPPHIRTASRASALASVLILNGIDSLAVLLNESQSFILIFNRLQFSFYSFMCQKQFAYVIKCVISKLCIADPIYVVVMQLPKYIH